MNRSHLWKFLLVVFVVGWAITSMWPPTSRPLIEVFQENIGKRDETYTNIMTRFAALQQANPRAEFKNLRDAIGTNDISRHFDIVDVRGERDPATAVLNALQKRASGKIKLGLDLQGGSSFLVELQTGKLATNASPQDAVNSAVEVLRKRVDSVGVAEPLIQPMGENRILIQMPGISESSMAEARDKIQRAAFLEFRMVHEESARLLQERIIPPGYEIKREVRTTPDGQRQVTEVLVSKTPVPNLTGRNVKRAQVIRGTLNDPQIAFNFDADGTVAFAKITSENIGRQMAILLDGELYSAPVIRSAITEGSGVISGGSMSYDEAKNIADILQNPLEAPAAIISEDRVDPSLGRDTIRSGINSVLWGTAAVALFMAVYYLFAGLVANFALLLNIIILIGIMAMFGTTLTLPGIAGILLTAGMAVDANVLIFERIREELAKGKSLRGAVAAGYSRAFGTIFDSNITTLISSIILIYFGSGSIKGFGVALTIGVSASLFTSLIVTRLIFDTFINMGWMKSMPMLRIIGGTKIDFMKLARPAFIATWILIFVGLGYSFYRGKSMVGFEFLGGDNVTLAFQQKVDQQRLEQTLQPVIGNAHIQYQRELIGTGEKLRVTGPFNTADRIESTLQQSFPEAGFNLIGSERVGPTVGKEILEGAIIALLLSLLGILVYVAFRYEFSFAVAAVAAVFHDVLMTVGIYALVGREMNSTMIAALLTIIGFSINDTIVIFDRIREDLKTGVRGTFREIINHALNQTLSRTLITSGTVFLATFALYAFGGGAINDFAFTFLVGILSGTFSTIYIASALVLWWHKGERPRTHSSVNIETAPVAAARA